MRAPSNTALAKWLDEHNGSVATLSDALHISRARAYHYVMGKSLARGQVLVDLMKLTGLPVSVLIPERFLDLKPEPKKRKRYEPRTASPAAR